MPDRALPNLDLRGLQPPEARARAFTGMFRIKPGQRVTILANSASVEQEIMKWIGEIGHRFLKTTPVERDGRASRAIELIKQDARR